MVPPRFDGAVVGGFADFRAERPAQAGWAAYCVATYVNWCGHGDVLPWRQADGSVRPIPVFSEAR